MGNLAVRWKSLCAVLGLGIAIISSLAAYHFHRELAARDANRAAFEAESERKLHSLQEELDKASAKQEELSKENERLLGQQREVENRAEVLIKRYGLYRDQNEQLRRDVVKLREENERLSRQRTEVETMLETLTQRYGKLREENELLRQDVVKLRDR
jgi:chromosome segregation ATPase